MKNKITRIFAVILVSVMALILVPSADANIDMFSINASAATSSGSLGGSVSWSYDTSTKILTVSGSGAMTNYKSAPSMFSSIKTTATEIVIKNGVTTVGNFAFHGFTAVKSITIASSVTTLGTCAFEGCTSLTSLNLNEGLVSIGNYCFKKANFSSFTAPSSLKTIGQYAFTNNTSLNSINLNSGLTTLDKYAFNYCTALESITIPSGIKVLSDYLFRHCASLTTVVLSEGVTALSANTFDNCPKFANITLPSTFVIGKSVFEGYTTLKNVTLAEGCTSVGEKAFYGCTGLESITIPSSVKTLGKCAFEGCTSLSTVNLSEGLKTIGAYCFKLTQFKDVELPYSVTKVDAHAFAMLRDLKIYCNYGDAAYNYSMNYLNSSYSQTYVLRNPEFEINSYIIEGGTKLKVVLKLKNASGFNAANLDFTYTDGITPVSTQVGSIETEDLMGTVVYNSPGKVSIALMSAECIPHSKCTGECEYTIGEIIFNIRGTTDKATLTLASKVFMLAEQRFTVATKVDTAELFIDGEHAHLYDSGVITSAATCKATGIKVYTCSICGDEKPETVPIDASYHAGETEIRNDVSANCISDGYTGDTHCKDCNAIIEVGETIPATGEHDYGDGVITTPATCKAEGVKTYTCTGCSDSYTEVIDISDVHTQDEGVVTVEATCISKGEIVYTCTVCGEKAPVTIKIDENNHKGETELKDNAAATCTINGYTGDTYCKDCGKISVYGEIIPAGHTEEQIIGYGATCSKPGLTNGVKCSVCNETIVEQEEIPATGHTEEPINGYGATCTEPGLTNGVKCSVCDETIVEQEEIPATGHTEEPINGYGATCTEPGLTNGVKCSVCDETIVEQEEIPTIDHDYVAVVTPPTCTDYGYTTYTCSECQHSYTDDETLEFDPTNHVGGTEKRGAVTEDCGNNGYTGDTYCKDCNTKLANGANIPATGNHSYTNEITTPATCKTPGERTYTCSVCEDSYTEPVEIDPNNHVGDTEIRGAVTEDCGNDGYTGDTYCKGCNTKIADGTDIPATGNHDYTSEITTPATCKTPGERTYTCSVCEDSYPEPVGIDKNNHTGGTKIVGAVTEDCGNNGYTGDTYCKGCNTKIANGTDVSATGRHTYNAGVVTTQPKCTTTGVKTFTCTVCRGTKTEPVAALGHSFASNYTVDKAATCTTAGSQSQHCTRSGCTATQNSKPIPATGHKYNAGAVTTQPKCTTTGVKTFTCTVCRGTKTETVAKLGHSFASSYTVDKAATCTTAGSKSQHCTRSGCTATQNSKPITATGHKYNAGTVTTQPKCTTTGVKTFTCTVCRGTKTEPVAALGHSFASNYTVDKAATCTTAGSQSQHCTRSGCTATQNAKTIPATGHKYNAGVVTTQPKCTTPGVKTFTCTVCRATKTETVAALGHSFASNYTVDKAATCTTAGSQSQHCTRSGCTAIQNSKTIPATGHKYNAGKVTTAATCCAQGIKTFNCTVCSDVKTEKIAIDPNNHTGGTELKNVTESTCTQTGYSGDTYCKGCGRKIADGKTIPVNPDKHSHTEQITEPTCTENGFTTHICECGDSYVDSYVDAKGHDFSNGNKCLNCDEVNITEITFIDDSSLYVSEITNDATQQTEKYVVSYTPLTADEMLALVVGDGWSISDAENNSVNGDNAVSTSYIIKYTAEVYYTIAIFGDVNLDGNVTAADARLALRASASLESLTAVQTVAANVDKNKDITAADARIILRVSAGLDKFM